MSQISSSGDSNASKRSICRYFVICCAVLATIANFWSLHRSKNELSNSSETSAKSSSDIEAVQNEISNSLETSAKSSSDIAAVTRVSLPPWKKIIRDGDEIIMRDGDAKTIRDGDLEIIRDGEADKLGKGRRVVFEVENVDRGSGTGRFVVQLHPEWAPLGVKQFMDLVRDHFYDDCRAFRVLPDFVSQFGINGDPVKQKYWNEKKPIVDDPVVVSNTRGTLTFATSGTNTRTTQVFINIGKSNAFLDGQGFAPFAEVVEGLEIVDKFYSGYGEGPDQEKIQNDGNNYLEQFFSRLSYFKQVSLE